MNGTRAVVVLSALLSLPAFADEPAATPAAPAAKPAKPARKAASKASAGSANMVVTKDPETGELRPATAAERQQLLGRQPLTAPEHRVVTLPDGSVMVELGEADRSYAVVTRHPDGTLSESCVHGKAAADRTAAAPAPPSAPAPATDR